MKEEDSDFDEIENSDINEDELKRTLKELETEADEYGFEQETDEENLEQEKELEEISESKENIIEPSFENFFTSNKQELPSLQAAPIENLEQDLQNIAGTQQQTQNQQNETQQPTYDVPHQYSSSEQFYETVENRNISEPEMTINPGLIRREAEIIPAEQQRMSFQPWQETSDYPGHGHPKQERVEDYVSRLEKREEQGLPFQDKPRKRRF